MRYPLVSVVIPSHNHARYVATTLQSVAEQTYRHLELIVIDDGSRDESPSVIERELTRLAPRFERVVYERHGNALGMERTFNEGIEASRGELVCPLASDNAFLPHKVLHIVTAPEWSDRRTGGVFADAEFMDADDRRVCLDAHADIAPCTSDSFSSFIAFHRHSRPPEMRFALGTYEDLLVGNYVSASAGAFRREALLAAGGYDESIPISDWDLLLRLASSGWQLHVIEGIVSRYRRHATNTFSVRRREQLRSWGSVLASQRSVARDLGCGDLWDRVAFGALAHLQHQQIDSADLQRALDGTPVS